VGRPEGETGFVVNVSPFEIVLHEEAAHRLVGASRADQRRLGAALDRLKSTPFRPGDLQELDAQGRTNEILIEGEWLLTFRADHAVREIRVVRLESVND
jgi:hypothetical protein